MAQRLPGPSTLEKGMILFTGAFIVDSAIQCIGTVASPLSEYCHIIQTGFPAIQFCNFTLFHQIAGYAHNITICIITGKLAHAGYEGTLDDVKQCTLSMIPGIIKFKDITDTGNKIVMEMAFAFDMIAQIRF